jgi:hypothetical protein
MRYQVCGSNIVKNSPGRNLGEALRKPAQERAMRDDDRFIDGVREWIARGFHLS